jgi:hypothetical protein
MRKNSHNLALFWVKKPPFFRIFSAIFFKIKTSVPDQLLLNERRNCSDGSNLTAEQHNFLIPPNPPPYPQKVCEKVRVPSFGFEYVDYRYCWIQTKDLTESVQNN